MEVYFHEHALKRYSERLHKIDHTNVKENGWVKIDGLKKEIKRKGKFKRNPNENGGFYCIVNGLKVYAGFEHGNSLYVITCYPYTKQAGNYYKTLKTIEFPEIK